MKVLITGITGFVGSHLAELLLEKPEVQVYGIQRWRSKTENIDHLMDRISMFECDIRDTTSIHQVIEELRPDRIFHLAAQSFVPASWHAPSETLMTNVIGQLNIFDTVRKLGLKDVRIHVAGSSEEYGLVREDELPITEENPIRPLSPYAVSKATQTMLGYQYHKSYGLHIVRTRAFNHTGPRRGEVFVASNFARQIAAIELGQQEPVLRVGNLQARRDFTDVRDVVKAYWLALEKGEPGEVYNICSERDRSIRQVLDQLLALTQKKIEVAEDPKRLRRSDVPVLRGDCSKFRAKTGWKAEIPFEQTIKDLLDYWRSRLGTVTSRKLTAAA